MDLAHTVRHLGHNISQAEWRALTGLVIDENYMSDGVGKKLVTWLRHGLPGHTVKMGEHGYVTFDVIYQVVQRLCARDPRLYTGTIASNRPRRFSGGNPRGWRLR